MARLIMNCNAIKIINNNEEHFTVAQNFIPRAAWDLTCRVFFKNIP